MIRAPLKLYAFVSCLTLAALIFPANWARAQTDSEGGLDLSIELVDPKVLRVCADPRNLPFSNEQGEGFENKLAELFAAKLQKKIDYMYFPQATGFVRMTLGAHRCDVIMGFPQGDDLVQGTNPYYRTAYALVSKPGSGLDDVAALDDARLKGKHIGIVAGTPPATNMAVNGLMTNAKPYPLMIDTRVDSSAQAMIDDLNKGEIDAAILWGPMAGFYAKKSTPPLHVTPLVHEKSGPQLVYRIGMGVRRADQNWKRLLNRLIQDNQGEINKILVEYGVPLLDGEKRADTSGAGDEITMIGRTFLLALALALQPFIARAEELVPEPDGYRTEDYRAPVPDTLAGARVLSTQEAETIWRAERGVFVDVLPRPPKPPNLPAGTVWRDKPRFNIPGSIWLPDTGYGELAAATEEYLRQGLSLASAGNRTSLMVIYCQADCWMSWNAAKRALSLGYSNIAWYPDGTDGWERAGLPTVEAQPAPRTAKLDAK